MTSSTPSFSRELSNSSIYNPYSVANSFSIDATGPKLSSTSIDEASRFSSRSTLKRESRGSYALPDIGAGGTRHAKVVVLGESFVGKTSLVSHFVFGSCSSPQATIGASFITKSIKTATNLEIKFNIWDTAGQEKYRSLATLYYRGVESAILVYDISDARSFAELRDYWLPEVVAQCDLVFKEDLRLVIVGNKVDLESNRQVSYDEGLALAKQFKAIFLETSARTGFNVESCFQELGDAFEELFISQAITGPIFDKGASPTWKRSKSLSLSVPARKQPNCCFYQKSSGKRLESADSDRSYSHTTTE